MVNLLARTPLRIKLVAAVLALVGCALVILGVATVTALRSYLISRVDSQLSSVSDQAEQQIRAGRTHLMFPPPQVSTSGVEVPNPYVLESLAQDRSLVDSLPSPLPSDAPDLTGQNLSHNGPVTMPSRDGTHRWRVSVVAAPGGQHVVVAASMADVDNAVGKLALLVVYVGLGALAAVTIVGVWLVRASLRPLAEIERTTTVIAAGDLSQRAPELDPRTEVGRLGRAFNLMVERIERAFAAQVASEAEAHASEEKMRQFVADASHELRTPLTTIRGFAELYRQSPADDPAAATRLVRRIEDEAQRMGLLVEDLLLLARMDQQRPLAVEPVDLLVLGSDAVESAHAIAPDRRVGLELTTPGPLIVEGDDHRLRQVLGNLVSNALRHTPPDASVTLRLGRRPNWAMIEVIDTGPGLSPEHAQRVFERFYRADPARTRRDAAGSGLGLAIVRAIVAAHGGTAEVDTKPGQGATFRVLLPSLNAPSLDAPTLDAPTRNDPTRNDPTRNDPSLNDPSLNDPSRNDPSLNDPSRNPPSLDDPGS